jgi:hypothetical protein
MTDGVITGNSIFIDGNAASLNTQIAANALKFLPASDLASNVANAINFAIGNTTAIYSTSNANIQIANTHSEYSFPGGTYYEDTRLAFGNTITDLDTHALSFTIGIEQTAGNIGQFYQSDSLVGYANTRLNVTGSRAAINGTIKWMPPVDYTGNVSFTYNQSKALATGNVTQASNVVANFTAITNPEISNMTDRTVLGNVVSNIFANTTPYINDGGDYGQSYTITLNSARGYFGNSTANAIASNTYSFTGNMTMVNNQFANVLFVPVPNATSGNFVYTQSRDGNLQANITANLTVTPNGFTPAVYTYSSNGTYTATLEERLFGNVNMLVVGGGGARSSSSGGGGGGGGGTAWLNISAGNISANIYSITIGANASFYTGSGNSTSVSLGNTVLVTASGGQGGRTNRNGGNTGTPVLSRDYPYNMSNTAITGGTFGTNSGGGGAGGDYVYGSGGAASPNVGGIGGEGYLSNISGANVYYAGGGGGSGLVTNGTSGNGYNSYGGGAGTGSTTDFGISGVVIIRVS